MCPQFASRRRGGRSRLGGTGRSRRRPLEWECSTLIDLISLPPATCDQAVILSRVEFDEEYSDSTLERVRGLVVVNMAPQVTTLEAHGAVGLIEVEGVDDVAAVPYCPFEDCDASWLWHSFWSIRSDQRNATDLLTATPYRFEVDAQARRRLEAGDSSLWFAIENDGTSNQNVEYWFGLRMLLSEK